MEGPRDRRAEETAGTDDQSDRVIGPVRWFIRHDGVARRQGAAGAG